MSQARVLDQVPAALDLHATNAQLAEASAVSVLRWAKQQFGKGLVLTTSFGAQSAVMLHLATSILPDVPVIAIDTGYLFEETYRYMELLQERLSLNLHVYAPRLSAARQEALYGQLWQLGDEGVQRYLEINKVEPMRRALAELGAVAWVAGLRADQTEHRASLRRVDRQNGRYKVHPILDWTDAHIEAYTAEHHLPQHPLVAQGYRSIGDTHSTLPTLPHQHPREGRLLGQKRECGIHLSA